jgi:hypothetical protein
MKRSRKTVSKTRTRYRSGDPSGVGEGPKSAPANRRTGRDTGANIMGIKVPKTLANALDTLINSSWSRNSCGRSDGGRSCSTEALMCVNPDMWKSTRPPRMECSVLTALICRARGTIFACAHCFGMRARLHDYEQTRIIIPTYLGVCVLICGALGWGFYQLMQPAQYANPGVAAYKAPPGLGITSLPRLTPDYERTTPTVAKNASELEHSAEQTIGHEKQMLEPEPAVAPVGPRHTESPRKQEHIRPARERREATTRERRETHRVPQSAAIQSHSFGGFGGAYAGYGALH